MLTQWNSNHAQFGVIQRHLLITWQNENNKKDETAMLREKPENKYKQSLKV